MIGVIDASVIVKWFFPDPVREPDSDRALAVLNAVRDGSFEPLQPPHWLVEVAAVIARLRPTLASEAIDLLDAMEFPVIGETAIFKRAAALASSLDQHLFDTLYHAVALERNAPLVTADLRYYRKARLLGQIVSLSEWEGVEK